MLNVQSHQFHHDKKKHDASDKIQLIFYRNISKPGDNVFSHFPMPL